MRGTIILGTFVLLLLGAPLALFVVQNQYVTAQLSINLGFVASKMTSPLPVPVLMVISLGVGLVLGGGWGLNRSRSASARLRSMERQAAVGGGQRTDEWGR